MIKLNSVLTLLGINDTVRSVVSAGLNRTVVSMTDGTILTIEKNAQPAIAVPAVETKKVAYFSYGATDRHPVRTNRKVIVDEPNTNAYEICGLDVNDSFRYKKFLRRKIQSLHFENEPVLG